MKIVISILSLILFWLIILCVYSTEKMRDNHYLYFTDSGVMMVRDFWSSNSWSYSSEPKLLYPYYVAKYYLHGKNRLDNWRKYYTENVACKPVGASQQQDQLKSGGRWGDVGINLSKNLEVTSIVYIEIGRTNNEFIYEVRTLSNGVRVGEIDTVISNTLLLQPYSQTLPPSQKLQINGVGEEE